MKKLPMCRLCLAENVRMYVVVNKNLHELYERMTGNPFITEDSRPMLACFVCCTKLKQCCQLQRQCLEAEELFTQMMNEDCELNLSVHQEHFGHSNRYVQSPMVHVSIIDECQTESDAIIEELPAVCERLDVIEPKEERLSHELELEYLYKSYSDAEDIPAQQSDSDSEDDVLVMDIKTAVEEEQEVPRRKRRVGDTTHEAANAVGFLNPLDCISVQASETSSLISTMPNITISKEDIPGSDEMESLKSEYKLEDNCHGLSKSLNTTTCRENATQKLIEGDSTEDEYLGAKLVKNQMHCKKRKFENIQKDKNRTKVSRRKYISDEVEVAALASESIGHEVMSEEIQTESLEGVRKDSCEESHDHKKMGKRRYDRRNACYYCQELVTNFSRHLLRNHPNEKEVIEYKAINDVDLKERKQKRQEITDKLRNKGNFIHNSNVYFDKDTILPVKRNSQDSSPTVFATCKMCLGTFKRKTFFRHFKKCSAGADHQTSGSRNRVLFNNSFTVIPLSESVSVELRDQILPHLRADEISLAVKSDPLILAYGSRLLKKKTERQNRKAICSKMRDLAALLIVLRKKDNSIKTLKDVFDPDKYEVFIDGIKTMCGFDEGTGFVKVASIPARMRPSVLGCLDILYMQSIMSTESIAHKDAYNKKLDEFKRLIEVNWEWEHLR